MSNCFSIKALARAIDLAANRNNTYKNKLSPKNKLASLFWAYKINQTAENKLSYFVDPELLLANTLARAIDFGSWSR